MLTDRSPKVSVPVDQQFQRRAFIHRHIPLDFINQLFRKVKVYTYAYQKAQEEEQPDKHHWIAFSISAP
jgi:hypothetical protein